MIYIANKKSKIATISKKYPQALILDVSSKGEQPWVKFSPFYPIGNIPIPPYTEHQLYFSQTVEGIWQGLKVFENEDIDPSKFEIISMEGIKRTVRKFGKPLGHRFGVKGNLLLDYPAARTKIYLRAYGWVLDNILQAEIQLLREIAEKHDIVLLDYNTNEDIEDFSKPLSHAGLIKRYLYKKYPELSSISFNPAANKKSKEKKKSQSTPKQKIQKQASVDIQKENQPVNGLNKTLFD